MCSKIAKRRRRGGGVTIISYYRENPIHETTREGINDLLADVHEVDDDRFPAPDNKPSLTGDTDRPVYKEERKWSGIYHRRAAGG